VKKLISIGIALALLAMVVLPGAVAAYRPPQTYSKVPFAIISSACQMIGDLWPQLASGLGMTGMDWIQDLLVALTDWTYGPLSWTVDMMAWGVAVGADVMNALSTAIPSLPGWIPSLLNTIACDLLVCWSSDNCTGNFTPCVTNST
jgi:hypothetical protein